MKKKILVVDDDRALRGLFTAVLRAQGYEVSSAEDGALAQQAVAATRPDIVVIDYLMPVLDGLEFLTWLKDSPYAKTQTIVLSAVDSPAYTEKFLAAGACRVLRKPIAIDALQQAVAEVAGDAI